MSPAMPQAQHTTPATPSTPRIPLEPVTPIATMTMAAISNVLSVSPLIGLFELPRRPTRYPATAEKRNPRTTIMTVNRTAPPRLWLKNQ